MNYQESLTHLQGIFLKHNFKDHQANSREHAAMVEVDRCQNGSIISISFPGYKATPDKPDYRVDITKNGITTSLSHANIIVDIINKCVAGGMNPSALRQALTNQAVNCAVDYKVLEQTLPYNAAKPSEKLIADAKAAHGSKTFNVQGNSWDLTIEELLKSIKWIAIQEDINYPIAQRYLGRKMPYGRYMEAIHVAEGKGHSLQEVIQRALSHSRPVKWSDMSYAFESGVN